MSLPSQAVKDIFVTVRCPGRRTALLPAHDNDSRAAPSPITGPAQSLAPSHPGNERVTQSKSFKSFYNPK